MIKIEHTEVVGWEPAIRGMRNPMNSWEKSDSGYQRPRNTVCDGCTRNCQLCDEPVLLDETFIIGPNDHDLMMRLCKAGSTDAKFRRMIICYADITAPLYLLKELDTYRMGVEKNSCSTMHKIHTKEFDMSDFSFEHLFDQQDDPNACVIGLPFAEKESAICPKMLMWELIQMLNHYRQLYLETKDKRYWWQMIQLLPSSYNQRRTYMFSYEALSKIYRERHNHKLDEWHQFCDWIETLPYSEIITLKENSNESK